MRSRQLLLLLALVLGACGTAQPSSQSPTQVPPSPAAPTADNGWKEPTQSACLGIKAPDTKPEGSAKQWSAPQNVIDPTHTYCAILTTNRGQIIVELYPQVAPKNVN